MPISLSNEQAGAITAAVVGLVTAWKLFFRGKKDIREDVKNGKIEGGYALVIAHLEKTVKDQGSKIDDQDQFIHQLAGEIAVETEKLRECERENHKLQLRIIHLERITQGLDKM